jgi:glycosyltransferase involved in cell wall biosynthesis
MRLTLAITTYERPDALGAVLATVERQTQPPDELIIADDGSGEATRALVTRAASISSFPVHYVRQEHDGFRVARLRNLAIAQASGEYMVFADGDMLLHPRFLEDHRRRARRGFYTQGIRVLLNAACTAKLIAVAGDVPSPTDHGLGGLRRLYAVHSPVLNGLMPRIANAFVAIKACNQGAWRDDLVAVNGFNEEITGWGPEDKELCARLEHSGVARQTLLFAGIAYHLYHPPASRSRHTLNEQVLAVTRARRLTRCTHGLDAHP